jgi:PKD repeat protein
VSYSNNIGNATVSVQPSQIGLESANITIREGEIGFIPIILTNCTDLQYVTGTFVFNNSVVEFVNVSSTASSINYENTTGLVRFNITYDEETVGDISVADIVMRGVGEPGEGTETKVIIDASDGLGLHSATVIRSNEISLIKDPMDEQELHANFTADVRSGLAPLTVQFTDESSGDPTAWLWDFGDGKSSTEQHPEYTYTSAKNYTVALSIDGGFSTATKSDYIKVTPILFGDANEDGKVNQADTLLVLRQVVELENKLNMDTERDRFQKTDVNHNGVIDVGDALFIAQYNVGLRDVWFEIPVFIAPYE